MSAAAAQIGAQPLLSVQDIVVRFGGVTALNGVSFDMNRGEIRGLIGPNGAGKTTLFNCLSRLYTPSSGRIVFCGQDLLKIPVSRIVRAGLARTFQNVAAFAKLSVLDNVRIGAHARVGGNVVSDALRLPATCRAERVIDAIARELVDAFGLGDVADVPVAALPFARQKRVELARALAAQPQLLLLDEPAGGLNQEEVRALGDLIGRVRGERGVSILLVEHNIGLVMSISDAVVVLDFGRVIAEGTPSAVRDDRAVVEAYLGGTR